MSAELSVSVHMEVKSYVIGLSSIPLSNQGSSLCYQEEAGNCPVVVSLLNYRRYRVVLTGQKQNIVLWGELDVVFKNVR